MAGSFASMDGLLTSTTTALLADQGGE